MYTHSSWSNPDWRSLDTVPYDESLEQISDPNHVWGPCERSLEAVWDKGSEVSLQIFRSLNYEVQGVICVMYCDIKVHLTPNTISTNM